MVGCRRGYGSLTKVTPLSLIRTIIPKIKQFIFNYSHQPVNDTPNSSHMNITVIGGGHLLSHALHRYIKCLFPNSIAQPANWK